MSLAPSTDLVLEVSRAADPARAAAVIDKLNALSRDGAASAQDFATTLESTAPVAPPSYPTPRPTAPASREDKARTQLEAVFLTQFIGEMLPKDAQSAYGQGYAGDMWRSMLAQRVADQIAASGRLGIASRLFAREKAAGGDLLAPQEAHGLGHAQTAQASANALSAPSAAEIENGAVLFSGAKPL